MRTVPDTKAPTSYQVLDATTGRRTNQFHILEKHEFRRAAWICRILSKLNVSPRSTNALLSRDERNNIIRTALDEIKEQQNPKTYGQVLQPFFSVMENQCTNQEKRRMLQLFSKLLTLILETSAPFLEQAQEQEPELGPQEHYRALANYWVYLIIGTIYHDDDTVQPLSDDVYAYSFVYPYSDDLLDGDEADARQKKLFCLNIASKILGGNVKHYAFDDGAVQRRECRVYQLMDKVLSNTSSRALRESFSAINYAQVASMKQRVDFDDMKEGVKSLCKNDEKKIFDISVVKGVASVMPDAHFCHPDDTLTKEQAELVAMVGAMGQFINDIEGLFEDLEAKSLTPALISYLKHGSLDRFMEKCLTYIQRQVRQARQQYPSLSQERVELLMHIVKLRILIAAAYIHDKNPESHVLSPDFCRGVQDQMGLDVPMFALLGRLEREIFGNLDKNSSQPAHQLSSPEHFRMYIVEQTEQMLT